MRNVRGLLKQKSLLDNVMIEAERTPDTGEKKFHSQEVIGQDL